MTLKRNDVMRIGCVGLGLSVSLFILWLVMKRFGFTHDPIKSNLALNKYLVHLTANLCLYINVHLLCKFSTGSVRLFDSLTIVGYVASGYLFTAILNTELELLYTTILPFVIILICAALKRQNILIVTLWLAIIFLITLGLQLLLITVHVGTIPFLNVPVSHGVSVETTLAIVFDQYLVVAFACELRAPSKTGPGTNYLSNFLFPIAVDTPNKSSNKKSNMALAFQIGIISAICITIGGFYTGISLIVSYLSFASVIKCQWQTNNPAYQTVVYTIVLSTACAIATFFHYPLLMPVACGFLANYFLYRMGLGNKTTIVTNISVNDTIPDSIQKTEEEPVITNERFSHDELAAFSFENCNESALRYLIEISDINNLYAELLIAKHCENLSGGQMEARFQNVGVARTRQRHLQKARTEILEFRDSLLKG